LTKQKLTFLATVTLFLGLLLSGCTSPQPADQNEQSVNRPIHLATPKEPPANNSESPGDQLTKHSTSDEDFYQDVAGTLISFPAKNSIQVRLVSNHPFGTSGSKAFLLSDRVQKQLNDNARLEKGTQLLFSISKNNDSKWTIVDLNIKPGTTNHRFDARDVIVGDWVTGLKIDSTSILHHPRHRRLLGRSAVQRRSNY